MFPVASPPGARKVTRTTQTTGPAINKKKLETTAGATNTNEIATHFIWTQWQNKITINVDDTDMNVLTI